MNAMKIILMALLLILPAGLAAREDPAPVSADAETSMLLELKSAKTHEARGTALGQLSGYYLPQGRLDKAVDAYRRTINDAKIGKREKYRYYQTIGDMYIAVEDYSSAIEYYQEAVNVLPRLEEARLKLAGVYEASDLNELAKQAYIDDLAHNKDSYEANFLLASLYLKLGLNTQAMDHFRKALTIRNDPDLYRKTALCAETAGDISIALAMLRQIPRECVAFDDLVNLGRLYEESGRFKEAEESFSAAIKMNTESIEAYIHLALLYLDNNNFEPAEKLLQIALEKAPNESAVSFFLGCIYNAQGKTSLAREQMVKAAKTAHTDILKRYSRKYIDFIANPSK